VAKSIGGQKMTKRNLYTIGYEGLSSEEFMDKLKSKGIDVLIDVRAISNSRKNGFSKSQLKANLEYVGVSYFHFRSLGTTTNLRDLSDETENFNLFSKLYRDTLDSASDIIGELSFLISENNCCLMCFEKEANQCHRSLVAEEVIKKSQSNVEIVHL